MNQVKRIFMNEADSSPGNGAPAEPAAPAEPTATPSAPAVDLDSLVARIAGIVDEKILASQNATHAALRKAGVFKQEKPAEASPSQPAAPAAAQSGLSMSDVEAMLERERVIASRAARHNLTEAQTRRLQSALSGVARESLGEEADSYLSDLGLVKTPPATPQQPAPTAPAKPNISDRGTASPTDTRDFEGVLNSRPLEMTGHDIESLTLKHGYDKWLDQFQERVLAALARVRIKPRG